MKKPHFDKKRKPYINHNHFKGKPVIDYTSEFDKEKFEAQSGDVVELFKLIQAVRYDRTNLQEEYQRVLLANSITLTPGTITADLTDNKLTVLWINKTTDTPEQIRGLISKSIEERLRKL